MSVLAAFSRSREITGMHMKKLVKPVALKDVSHHSGVLVSITKIHLPAAVKHLRTEEMCHTLVSVQKVGTSAVCHVIGRCFSQQ